jgi:hypothetical protein
LENNQALSLPTRIATCVTRLVHPKINFDFDAQLGKDSVSVSPPKSLPRSPRADFVDAFFQKEWLQSDRCFNPNTNGLADAMLFQTYFVSQSAAVISFNRQP